MMMNSSIESPYYVHRCCEMIRPLGSGPSIKTKDEMRITMSLLCNNQRIDDEVKESSESNCIHNNSLDISSRRLYIMARLLYTFVMYISNPIVLLECVYKCADQSRDIRVGAPSVPARRYVSYV